MKPFFLNLLGEVLHIANSQPPILYKYKFYRMKDKILRLHGEITGFDVQHIIKECWGCYGSGYQEEPVNNMGVVVSLKHKCRQCGGTGIYTQFWTHLLCYKLGKRGFHLPTAKYYVDPQINPQRPIIKGYVQHQKYPYYLSTEAFYWLALLFDFALFQEIFGRWGMSARKYTPMVILSNFVWEAKRFFRLAFLRDWYLILKSKLTWLYQSRCRHEFPIGNRDFDECKKCGVSRWQTLPRDVLDEEFPF